MAKKAKKAAKKAAPKKKKKLAGKKPRVAIRKKLGGYVGGLKLDKKESKLLKDSTRTAEGRAMTAANMAASGIRRMKRSEGGAGGE